MKALCALSIILLLGGCSKRDGIVGPPDTPIVKSAKAETTWVQTTTWMYSSSRWFDWISVETDNSGMDTSYSKSLPKALKVVNHSDRDTAYYIGDVVGYYSADRKHFVNYYAKVYFADTAYTNRFGLSMSLTVYAGY